MSAEFHSPPFMPLYCGDYLRDTQRLSTEEHGAYLLLIMEYWVTGAPLPDDDVALSRVCRASVKRFRHLLPRLRIFFAVGDGFWRHKRIDAELIKAGQISEFRHLRAKSGAAARWGKNASSIASSIASDMLKGPAKQCPSQPQPYKNPSPERTSTPPPTKKPRKRKGGSPLASPPSGRLRGEPSLVIDDRPPRPGSIYTARAELDAMCATLGVDPATIKPLTAADAPAAKAGLYGQGNSNGWDASRPAVFGSDERGGTSNLPRAIRPRNAGIGINKLTEFRVLPLATEAETIGPINGRAQALPASEELEITIPGSGSDGPRSS